MVLKFEFLGDFKVLSFSLVSDQSQLGGSTHGNFSSFIFSSSCSNFELSDSQEGEPSSYMDLFAGEEGLNVRLTLQTEP